MTTSKPTGFLQSCYGKRKDGSIWISIGEAGLTPHYQFDFHAPEQFAQVSCEAIEVFTVEGKSPRELADQRDELLHALELIASAFEFHCPLAQMRSTPEFEKLLCAKEAITKSTEKK